MKRITFILALFLFASQLAYGQAGYLDETFGNGGKTIISVPQNDFVAYNVAILPNGKILQSGVMHDDLDSWGIIMRYNSNGIIDSTFGKDGRFAHFFLWPVRQIKIAHYPDGRILAYGTDSYSTRRAFVLRILPNGVLDSTFGENGMYRENDFTILTDLTSLKIRDDGKIILAGGRGSNNGSNTFYFPSITLLTSDGHLDTLFGDKGRSIVSATTDTLSIVSTVIGDDGFITFGCSPLHYTNYSFSLMRCDMSGTLDTLFGNKGIRTVSHTDNSTYFTNMHVLQSGEIYCLVNIKMGWDYHVGSFKFTADGKDEMSFGNNGYAIIKKDEGQVVGNSLILDSNNRIIVAGHSNSGINTTYATALRLNSNGSPDSTFAVYGMSGVMKGYNGEGNTVAVQKDGKYVVAGSVRGVSSSYADNLIFRLHNTGTSNVSPALCVNAPISIHPTPSTDNCTITYTLPTNSDCSLTLRDESGRAVKTFMTSEFRASGKHEDKLDLRGLAAGVYFLSLEHGGNIKTTKLIKQ